MAILTTVPELAKEGHKSADRLYELARREEDPLPVRYMDGDRYGVILVDEFAAWLKRNGRLYNERT